MISLLTVVDERPQKHGWYSGMYYCKCNCCGGEYIGAKGSYNCANCAYTFDKQLTYEELWREVGWFYTAKYVMRSFNKRRKQ